MLRDKSLVQAIELWLPQGEVMAFGKGAYRGNHDLATRSPSMRFQYGEGLPGAVWANGRALLWNELAESFVRAELAADVGIDAALGFPLFDGERLVSVLTLLLSRRSEAPSSTEIWDVNEELDVLKHGRGYYAHCTELERFSPHIQFPRGTGLPGLTWQTGGAHIMADVRQSNAFIRAGLAARCGLQHGVGLPIYRNRRIVQVLALLGAERQPCVTSVELYHPQGTELGAATLYDWTGPSSPSGASVADAPGRQLAREVLASCTPAIQQINTPGGYEVSLALPLHDRKGLKDIVVLRV
jgi:hypothetical protein